jgi:hypothetical protein
LQRGFAPSRFQRQIDAISMSFIEDEIFTQ